MDWYVFFFWALLTIAVKYGTDTLWTYLWVFVVFFVFIAFNVIKGHIEQAKKTKSLEGIETNTSD